jgi:hypothetical protein
MVEKFEENQKQSLAKPDVSLHVDHEPLWK